VFTEIPKKTGKSELAAAVALYMLCADGEQGAEIYGCATDRQQASIVFSVALDMILQCPALKKRVKIVESQKRIIFEPTRSIYQVLSSEVASKYGYNVHACIICYEVHSKAADILDGRKHDSTFYTVVYSADNNADWTDPKVWRAVNPSLGITVDEEYLRLSCESAKQNPAEEMQFRQFFLCQWTSSAIRWMPMEKWDACAFPVDPEALRERICYGGLDLSSTTDITAFVLVFPPVDEDDKYAVLPFFWMPEDNIDLRVRRDHVPYDVWEKQGYLLTTDGNVVHYGFIEKFIEELGTKYNIREIAFDRWGAVQMVQNLEGMGFTVVPFGQGFKDMSPPTKELMKLTLEEKLAHGGHPVLRWMMDNIFIRTDPAGNIKPDKEKSTERIDGAVATVMALDRALRHMGDGGGSVYDDRGLFII
jgi:phage terminase large subunit-like protein